MHRPPSYQPDGEGDGEEPHRDRPLGDAHAPQQHGEKVRKEKAPAHWLAMELGWPCCCLPCSCSHFLFLSAVACTIASHVGGSREGRRGEVTCRCLTRLVGPVRSSRFLLRSHLRGVRPPPVGPPLGEFLGDTAIAALRVAGWSPSLAPRSSVVRRVPFC